MKHRGTLGLLLLLVCYSLAARRSGSHSTYTRNWRTYYAYNITTASVQYTMSIRGKTCKTSFVNFIYINGAASTATEDLEETGEQYMSLQYPQLPLISPWSTSCTTTNAQSSSGLTGNCQRRIIKQDLSDSTVDLTAVAITADNDRSQLVEIIQLKFNASKSESCTNSASGDDAHAGHNHRRSGDHSSSSDRFSVHITFPSTGYWYFFSDQDMVGDYEMKLEDNSHNELTAVSHEIKDDPNACSSTTEEESCNCDCDDEKYMWSGLILGVGLLGMLPLVFNSLSTNKRHLMIMGLFNCFGGGALLATAVGHVFPEAIDLYPFKDSDDYPLSALMASAGYWVLLFLDKVMLSLCVEKKAEEDNTDGVIVAGEEPNSPTGKPLVNLDNPKDPEQESNPVHMGHVGIKLDNSDPGAGQGHGGGLDPDDKPDAGGCEMEAMANGSWLQAAGVFLAMAVHSILAGFTLGLKCDQTGMENLAIAIVCHKIFDVSALGIVLVRAKTVLWKSIILLVIVALMTPVGCWIGIAVGDTIDNDVNGICQSFASGTFLYVAIQEVLAHEFSINKHMVLKSILTFLGISMIWLASIANTRGGHTH